MNTMNTTPTAAGNSDFVYEKLASISEPIEAASDFCHAIVGFLAIDVTEHDEALGNVIHRIGREIQARIELIGNVQSEIMEAINPRPVSVIDDGHDEVEQAAGDVGGRDG